MSVSGVLVILGVVAFVLAVAFGSLGWAIIGLLCILAAAMLGGRLRL